jgi:hypothetical protein
MSRTSSRRNLQLDDCPEEEPPMSCADAVRAACCSEGSEWQQRCSEWMGDLEFPLPASEPMPFEPALMEMAEKLSIQA